jgi:hypothetical protein
MGTPPSARQLSAIIGAQIRTYRWQIDLTHLSTEPDQAKSRYTLAYEPADTSTGGVKHVRVLVAAPHGKDVNVRTRTGYVAGTSSPPAAATSGK